MRRWALVLVLTMVALGAPGPAIGAVGVPPSVSTVAPAPFDPLLQQAVSAAAPGDEIVAIANLDRPATAATVDRLADRAGKVMAYPHLPMAAVIGTPAQLSDVAGLASVRSLYWNEPQVLHTNESSQIVRADEVWPTGVDGTGVGVAVIDGGVDATHPDLADHVGANVKVLGPETIQLKRGDIDDVFVEDVPSSDTTSGHGTHVAGDVAADGTASDGKFRGPAPNATLIGLGAGEGLNIFTALAAFDWVVAHHAEHNIRIVNNSWGTSFRLHDPQHPVLRAAKVAAEAGMTVVFSAGNRYEEMTLTPYAAPWTVTVAAGAKAGGLTAFSSRGVEYDNLPVVTDPAQTDFVSTDAPVDGVGRYHPSLTGIGENVASTRAAATVTSALGLASGDEALSPTEIPYYTHASGTSMSAPQVSGVAALAQQAFHAADDAGRWLTPAQLKAVLQLGARRMEGLKLFQQGHGLIDAVDIVTRARSLADKDDADIDATLADGLAARHVDAAAERGADIVASYAWRRPTLDSAGGLAKHVVSLSVPAATDKVRAIISFPPTTQLNVASVDLYLFDAAGKEVGRATASSFSHGVQKLNVDISTLPTPPTFGTWTLEARGDISSNCFSGTVPRCVKDGPTETWLTAILLDTGSTGGGGFVPTGSRTLYFHNESAGTTPPPGLVKPGYRWDGDLVSGTMADALPDTPRAGFAGYAHTYAPGVARPAVFTSAPLDADVTVGKELGLDVFLQNEAGTVGNGNVGYWLYEVKADGERRLISSQELLTVFRSGADPVANRLKFPLSLPYTAAAGSRLELHLKFSAAVSAPMRFYYDAPAEPAALVLTTGTIG